MVRAVLPVLIVIGCGRVAFDPTSSGDGATSDDGPGLGDADNPFHCLPTYTEIIGTSRYRVENRGLQWTEAEAVCESEGAHLAVVDSMAEMTAITRFALYVTQWTGASQRAIPGTWLRVTGGAQALLPWATGFPMGGGGRDCVQWTWFSDPVLYENTPCNNALPSLCECDGVPPDLSAY